MMTKAYFQDTRPGAAATTQRIFRPAVDPWGRTGEIPMDPPAGYETQPITPMPFVGTPGEHRKSSAGSVILWVVASLLFSLLLGGALTVATGGGSNGGQTPTEVFTSMPVKAQTTAPSAAASKAAPVKKAAALPGVGDKVTIEQLQYLVHGMKCGITQVGPKDFGATAQGQYCRVDVSVTNRGGDPQTWDASYNVTAQDAKGREFRADGTAAIFGNVSGRSGFLDQINPGNTTRGYVFFDLPKGEKITTIKVSSGWLGEDARIQL